jgi:hypothetical protein
LEVEVSMIVMRHRTFQSGRRVYWGLRDAGRSREQLHQQAEDFINTIGADKVVSVTGEVGFFGVTVWYREEAEGGPQQAKLVMAEL